MNRSARASAVTWLAVIDGAIGYALDAYPDERERYLRERGRAVLGEFASRREAMDALLAAFRGRRA